MTTTDDTVARELLTEATRLVERPGAGTLGLWPRASALLARQALEVALRTYWSYVALSCASHHHVYELPPTRDELVSWFQTVGDVVEQNARGVSRNVEWRMWVFATTAVSGPRPCSRLRYH